MAAVAQKLPPPNSYSHVNLRRRSSAHSATSSTPSRNGSVASSKSQPAWLSSIQERDRSQSTIESQGGLKGLFGRKKPEKKQEKIILGSKHAALVKNNLKADPRGARKQSLVKTAGVQGTQKSAHLTAEQQEMRHPHSGPPALPLRGTTELPALTRIVSGDEEDEWDHERKRADWEKRKVPEVEKVVEERHGEEERAGVEVGGVENSKPRRRSLLDVEIRGGEGAKPQRRRSVLGGWAKDGRGVWHRG